MKRLSLWATLGLVLLSAACGPNPMPRTHPINRPNMGRMLRNTTKSKPHPSGPVSQRAARQMAALEPAAQRLFAAQCASCHGARGEGTGSAPRLLGTDLRRTFPTVTGLSGFIRQNMPASRPGSLTITQAQELAAWLYQHNHA